MRLYSDVMSTATDALLERVFIEVGDDEDVDATSDRILRAAVEQFCAAGIRRSTMADVAHRAGVSRITVYRRFATKEVLVEHAVRREFRRYFDQFVVDIAAAETLAERVVAGFTSALRTLRGNALIGRMLAEEPDVLMPSMIGDGGQTLATVCRFLAGRLRREQAAGHVAAEVDVDQVAEMMVRISASFLAMPCGAFDLDDDAALARIAERFLAPMLRTPSAV